MRLTSLASSILYRATFRPSRNTIMTTTRSMQQVLDDLEKNPYFDKYADKIAKLRKEDPAVFKNRIEKACKDENKKKVELKERNYSQLLNAKKTVPDAASLVKKEPLDNIMKTDLIKDKSSKDIELIWQKYHLTKDHCIAATIPGEDYLKLTENSLKFPTFLFAIPRSQGYEFMLCQFSSNKVHFTPLLYYQVHKENAPECLTITHYDEFKEEKGIVLMRGEYDKNVIDASEAQCLANQLQLYYVRGDEEKRKLLETFNERPDEFKHMEIIKQIENLSIK